MTNRDLINFFRAHGYENVTPVEYDRYTTGSTDSGYAQRERQSEYLVFEKDYGNGPLSVAVTNDRWCFNGWNDENYVVNGDLWTNYQHDNEDYHPTGAVLSIKETSDGLKMDIRFRNRKTNERYVRSVEVGAGSLED